MPVIAFIANYPEMIDVAKEVFATQKAYALSMGQIENHELVVISASTTDSVLEKRIRADVVIARGGIVYDLKRVGFHLPVVEVFVAGSDLVVSLNEAKQTFGPLPTAVIGSMNMIAGIEHVSEAMGFEIKPYYLRENSIQEVVRNVEAAKSDGMRTVVGGSNGIRHAKTLGLNGVLIKSGRESIWQAIAEAKRIAEISIQEQTKTLMHKTIMDYAYEGIIAIDRNQNVLVFNDIGQKILGLPRSNDYVKKHIDSVITNKEIAALVKEDRDSIDEMARFGDLYLTFNNVPVVMGGERVGRVFTFQNASRLEELEGKIRGKLFTRGHRAKYSLADIIGESPEIVRAKHTASRYAAIDSNVLIIGETGTGKELFAQSIHMMSPRAREAFVAINCAALSESLLESELFGYVEGAFTGASKGGKKGLFEVAHNGTIFLDEISEIPMSLQGKLLRVIQEREVMRLGHDRILPINVRVISATNKELRDLIAQGKFREDLYFRLNVFNIRIPPLRQRQDDIVLLARQFLIQFSQAYGKNFTDLSEPAKALLRQYRWPGNIRELRNMSERLAALSMSDIITEEEVMEQLNDQYIDQKHPVLESPPTPEGLLGNAQERRFFEEALQRCCYNKTKAARMLGISRVTLWRKLKETGLTN